MGSRGVQASMLHRARSGMSVDRLPVFAGHGVLDTNLRPSSPALRLRHGRLNLEERAAQLAADEKAGDTMIWRQPDREPPGSSTLLRRKRRDGAFVDHMTGLRAVLGAEASVDAAGLQRRGNATARLRFDETPPIPNAWIDIGESSPYELRPFERKLGEISPASLVDAGRRVGAARQ